MQIKCILHFQHLELVKQKCVLWVFMCHAVSFVEVFVLPSSIFNVNKMNKKLNTSRATTGNLDEVTYFVIQRDIFAKFILMGKKKVS